MDAIQFFECKGSQLLSVSVCSYVGLYLHTYFKMNVRINSKMCIQIEENIGEWMLVLCHNWQYSILKKFQYTTSLYTLHLAAEIHAVCNQNNSDLLLYFKQAKMLTK